MVDRKLSMARGFLTATAVGNKVIIAGGMTSDNQPTDRVDIYNVETGIWTTSSLSTPRAFLDNAAKACGKAFFAGGGKINLTDQQWELVSDVVDIYDTETEKWSVEKLRNPITNHSVVANTNHIAVIGGTDLNLFYSYVDIYTCLTSDISISGYSGWMKLNPNPANETIEITFSKIEKEVKVTISGISGQVVLKSDISNALSVKLNLTHFKTGVYIVKTKTAAFCTTQKLMIVNKQKPF